MRHHTEIVPFELAVKLKKVGYPQLIKNGVYAENGQYLELDREYLVFPFISAPTYADVFDWLMENGYAVVMMPEINTWDAEVYEFGKGQQAVICIKEKDNWYAVASEAIEKTLEL